MAATTRIAALKDAIVDGLRLVSGLDGVEILSAAIGERNAKESIFLVGEDFIDQDWGGIGRLARDESITLTGAIIVKQPGKGEDNIRAARTRAVALMALVEAFFWDTSTAPSVGGIVKSALARPVELNEFLDGDGSRIAAIRFEIRTGKTRLQNS